MTRAPKSQIGRSTLSVGCWVFLYWSLLFAFHCSAQAAVKLTATPITQDLQLRRNSPISIEIQLTNLGTGIVEGRLEASVLARNARSSVQRTPELVLSPGARTVSMLLPPPIGLADGERVGLSLRWVGKEESIDLGESRIGSYGFSSNELVVAVVRTERRRSDLDVARERSLHLETLRPRLDTPGWQSFNTLTVSASPQSLPTAPIGWCAYDAVVFDTTAFAAASEKQLASLARWIEAGGSAFISVCDAGAPPLAERHEAFLRRLAGDESGAHRFVDGALVPTGTAIPAMVLDFSPALGRLAIQVVPATDKEQFEANGWRVHVARLWKMRAFHVSQVAVNGTWGQSAIVSSKSASNWFGVWMWTSAVGYDALSPDKPRPLPVGLVALVLGTLLLAVGPGDWLFLGWLRRRRWTWVLLPALCLIAAWWAHHLARSTIGRGDITGLVTITDIGPGGKILRTSRLDLLLPSNDREWTVSVRDGLAAPFPRHAAEAWNEELRAPMDEVAAEWKTPTLFELRRNLRQWSPVMTQSTSFPEATDGSGIPWDKVEDQWKSLPAAERQTTSFSRNGWNIVISGRHDWPWTQAFTEDFRENWIPEVHGLIPEEARMKYPVVAALVCPIELSHQNSLLTHRSPTIAGLSALSADTSAPLIAIAWKESPHALEIIRHHYRQAE